MAIRRALRVLVVLVVSNMMLGESKEMFVDDDGPIVAISKLSEYDSEENDDATEHAPCHLEYQVMKRVVGTCIKLGRTTRGCVSGNYLHPHHPECM